MKIYVASKLENREAVRDAYRLIREAGHAVSYDWTVHAPACPGSEYQRSCAQNGRDGVLVADALLLLIYDGMRGALVELGIAIGAGKTVVVVGAGPANYNVFLDLPGVHHVGNLDDALRLLDQQKRTGINAPEPAPKPNGGTPVWDLVIEDMRQRDTSGRAKYGTPLQAHNGRDALVDAYQEALDLVVDLRQAIEERPK